MLNSDMALIRNISDMENGQVSCTYATCPVVNSDTADWVRALTKINFYLCESPNAEACGGGGLRTFVDITMDRKRWKLEISGMYLLKKSHWCLKYPRYHPHQML